MRALLASSLLLAAFAAHSSPAAACSCAQLSDDFFQTVSMHNEKVRTGEWPASYELTVVTGQVTDYLQLRSGPYPTEMRVVVDHVVQGTLPTDTSDQAANVITVEGDDGMQCRPYVTQFPIGQRFVFALTKLPNGRFFEISVCGKYALPTSEPSP